MSQIWFSSDLHLGHANIIKFCNRPFQDVDEMTEKLREAHNALVKPEDKWYFLGDLTMKRNTRDEGIIISEMAKWNGHKRMIMGNHDHFDLHVYRAIFEKIVGTGRWFANMWFSHFPIHPESMGNADACVHGHIHDSPSPKPVIQLIDGKVFYKPYINVSVEAINYRPVSLDELVEMVKKARGADHGSKAGREVAVSPMLEMGQRAHGKSL